MPPSGGGPGGPGFGPFAGGLPANSTMGTANQLYDFIKTTRMPGPVGGLVGGGYVPSDEFSFIDIYHRIQLARTFSIHSNGASRFRSFIGNYQVLSNEACKRARLDKMVASLDKRRKNREIDDQTWGNRVMYEALQYFGWLKRNTVLTKERYRTEVMEFAEKHGIDFSFGDEAPARTR